MDLPKVGNARLIGNVAVELLSSVLSNNSNVVSVPVEKDLGIDLMCELLQSGTPTGMHFYVQCKGTDQIKKDGELKSIQIKKDGELKSIQIKVSTLNYWLISRVPVFIVLVDKKNKKFYWEYPFEQIKDRFKDIQQRKKVNIAFSKRNCFSLEDKKIPADMKKIIENFDYTEISMLFKKFKYGAFKVDDIFKLYRTLRELKNQENTMLSYVEAEHLHYVQKVREDFNYFFVTSEIKVWYKYTNQLCFSILRKTENNKCYFIANIVISFGPEGTLDHLVELANGDWLNTKGDIYDVFEPILEYLNKLYK